VSTEKIRKLRFFQPNDYVSIDFHQQEARVLSLTEGRQIMPRPLEIRRDQPLRLEIAAFLEAVRGEAPAKAGCTGWEARRALELALQLQSQMATK
jgi:predicted dehydrogenase